MSHVNEKVKLTSKARLIALTGAILLIIAALWGVRGRLESMTNGFSSGGPLRRLAPSFKLKSADGKTHSLEELRGNAVVLHFWASWCPPCLEEIPQWIDFAGRWQGKPVRFVAISLDKEWKDALKVFPESKTSAGVLSLLDTEQTLPEEYGTYQFPETYLLNGRLEIVAKWIGGQDWNNPAITRALENVSGKL